MCGGGWGGLDAQGVVTTLLSEADGLSRPVGMAVTSDSRAMYIADDGDPFIYKFELATGEIAPPNQPPYLTPFGATTAPPVVYPSA